MACLISHAKSVTCCEILCTMFVKFPWVLLCVLRNFMGAPELCYVSDPFGCCDTIYFFLWVCSSRSFAVVTMMNFRGILLRTVVGDEIFMGAYISHRTVVSQTVSIALLASCSCYLVLSEPTATWRRWFAWVCRTGTESDILVRFCLIRI